MSDAGIGQQPLDIRLRDGNDVADDHRQRRDHSQDGSQVTRQ